MLETIKSIRSVTNPKETEGKVSGKNVVGNSIVDSSEATN